MAEHARAQVGLAAQRVDQLAIGLARNGVDGEIAAAQIVFQRHVDTGMEGEALVAVAGLALGAGERVFLFGARMQEHRKIAAHGHEAPARHILGVAPTTTSPDRRPAAQQGVAHRAAHDIHLQALGCGVLRHGSVVLSAPRGTTLPSRSFRD